MRPTLCVIGPCVRLRSRVSRPRASPPGVSAGGRVRNVRAIIHAWDTCDKNVIQPYSEELFEAGVLWATALILTRLACMASMSAPRPPRLSTVSPAWKTGWLSHRDVPPCSRDGRAAAARQRSWLSGGLSQRQITGWLNPRPSGLSCGKQGGSTEASLSARSRFVLPGTSASLGQSAARAALAGHTGLVFHIGAHRRSHVPAR